MSKYQNLTEADNAIMEIIWRDGECKSADIQRELADILGWTRQTVRTYLQRLIDKGLVATRKLNQRTYCYYPLVSREEYAADKAGSVFNRYYRSLPHMVSGLLENESISSNELDELERLIQQYRDKDGASHD